MSYSDKHVTFVVGMHRAGTSAVAGALSECGFSFGENLIPEASENIRGFYERQIVCSLHDELLYNLDSSWFGLAPLPEDWITRDASRKVKKRLTLVLKKMLTRSDRPAIKDPRLCRLFPIWEEICCTLGIEVRIIRVLRHPMEVAASLQKRNAFLPTASFRLYTIYMMEAEAHLQDHDVATVFYEDLIEDPRKTMASLYLNITGTNLNQTTHINYGIDFSLYRNKSGEVSFSPEFMKYYNLAIGIYHSYRNNKSLPTMTVPYFCEGKSTLTSTSQQPYLLLSFPAAASTAYLEDFFSDLPRYSLLFSVLVLTDELGKYVGIDGLDAFLSKFSLVLGKVDRPDILLSLFQHTTYRNIVAISGSHVVAYHDLRDMIEKACMEPTRSKAWVYHKDDYALSAAVAHALKSYTVKHDSSERLRLEMRTGSCAIIQFLGRGVREAGICSGSGAGCGYAPFFDGNPINRIAEYVPHSVQVDVTKSECTVLIPIHDAYHQTRQCIESVLENTDPSHSVVLLDDATSDIRLLEYMTKVASRFSHVTITPFDSNHGYIKTVNRGIAESSGDVVVLNSDTQVTSGWLEKLLECLHSKEIIGIVCPLSNNATLLTIPDPNSVNRLDHLPAQLVSGLVEKSSRKRYPAIPTAVGFCMLIRRELINKIGLFDEVYGRGYSEECDYSMRAWRAGYEVTCADNAYVYHEGGASFSRISSQLTQIYENENILYRRFPDYLEAVRHYCVTNPLRDAGERVHSLLTHAMGDLRPRLLMVTHRYDTTGGVELHLRGLVSVLSKYYRITIIHSERLLSSWTDVTREQFENGIELVSYNRANIQPQQHIIGLAADIDDPVVTSWFRRFIAHGHWDVVHFHHLAGWNNMRLPEIAKSSGARVVLSLHDMYLLCPDYNMRGLDGYSCGRRFADGNYPGCGLCIQNKHSTQSISRERIGNYLVQREKRARDIVNQCDSVIFPSSYFFRRFVSAYGDDNQSRYRVIPHGIPAQGFHEKRCNRKQLSIAFVGRFCYAKGAEVFLGAVERLNRDRFNFYVIGHSDDRYRKEIARLNIEYHGRYDYRQLVALTKNIDIVIIPSIFTESYCITLSECQALGLPVIASRIGAIPERILHNSTGFLVTAGDKNELATMLNQLYDEQARLYLVRDRLKTLSFPTIEENAEAYHRLYSELMSSRKTYSRKTPDEDLSESVKVSLGVDSEIEPKYLLGTRAYCDYCEREDDLCLSNSRPIGSILPVIICNEHSNEEIEVSVRSIALCKGMDVTALLITGEGSPDGKTPEHNTIEIINAPTIAAANRAIAGRHEKWLFVFEAGDSVNSNEWSRFVGNIGPSQKSCCYYGDMDRITSRGERYAPLFLPDFDIDLMRSTLFLNSHILVKRSTWHELGGFLSFEGGIADLALRTHETHGNDVICHFPGVLLHRLDASEKKKSADWRKRIVERHLFRCGVPARVRSRSDGVTLDVRYRHSSRISFTVILSVWGGYTAFPRCIAELAVIGEGIFSKIVVVLFGNEHFRSTCSIERFKAARINIEWVIGDIAKPFVTLMSSMGNISSDYLLFFDVGLDAVSDRWFESLLATMSQEDVAAVGCSTLSSIGDTVGGGVVLGGGTEGIGMVAPYQTTPEWRVATPVGSGQRAVSCLTNDCLLVRSSDFKAFNGFDVRTFPASLGMIDLSLRWYSSGKRLVVDPSVQMHSKEPYPRSSQIYFKQGACKEEELAELFSRWLPELKSDSAYNSRLSLERFGEPEYQFSGVRVNPSVQLQRIAVYPFDDWAIGEYRARAPMRALAEVGWHEVTFLREGANPLPTPVEIERGDFDVVYLHNALHDQHLRRIAQYRFLNELPVVFGQDDLLTHLPEYNPFSKTNYANIADRLQGALGLCNRLIVTTEPLAKAYSAMGIETVVIPNYLERERWAPYIATVEQRKFNKKTKPRVGWAGASQHAGDLELLIPVVEHYSSSIDWVFFGDCPPELMRHAKEVHGGVPFAQYPEKLASLCLDLALAPLACNEFNEAKSNLKILEYGVLGYPVLCSNLRPYQDAPVALSENSSRAWIDSIGKLLEDRHVLSLRGKRLQRWVLEGWMLDQHIDEWAKALDFS